jgi:hypothetical protein
VTAVLDERRLRVGGVQVALVRVGAAADAVGAVVIVVTGVRRVRRGRLLQNDVRLAHAGLNGCGGCGGGSDGVRGRGTSADGLLCTALFHLRQSLSSATLNLLLLLLRLGVLLASAVDGLAMGREGACWCRLSRLRVGSGCSHGDGLSCGSGNHRRGCRRFDRRSSRHGRRSIRRCLRRRLNRINGRRLHCCRCSVHSATGHCRVD